MLTSLQTPLTVAARKGSLSCVKVLLYHGADVNLSVRSKNRLQNHKVWYYAKKAGHLQVEQYLRKCSSK
jgi:ankyrin repeat protein